VRETVYRPDSTTWQVNQEPALLLAGGRALLMQLAHPGVAAGVAEHSDFQQRPVRRLLRTLELTLALTFGTRQQALAAARQINGVHQRVRGDGYSASDPRLLLWVHATLIDSALVAYRVFVGGLSEARREAYYQEAKLIGGLLGVPAAAYPPGLAAGDELAVDGRALALAGAVVRPPLRLVPALAYRPLEAITAGLLPERLRTAYGLRWSRADRLAFGAARRGVPRFVAILPRSLRQVPPARRERRVALTP
jgi:uncharacterized protein (DUF2236 family)